LVDVSFKTAPASEDTYQVGDHVQVFCDHEIIKGDRMRDWLEGIVVQVDPKIVAVQFTENVYLTDGWMIPDHVLWCPPNSTKMRHLRRAKRRPREK
jgi:hypothetical protein